MKRSSRICALCVIASFIVRSMPVLAGTAATTNVTGAWRFVDNDGDEGTLNLVQEGEGIKGTLWQWSIPHTLSNGTLRGDTIKMTLSEGPTLGATVNGDKMTNGTFDTGTGRQGTWTARRQVAGEEKVSGFGVIVREFTANRQKLVEDLSKQLSIQVPEEVNVFFKAAHAGDWVSITNSFRSFLRTGKTCDGAIPALFNELWVPIHETFYLHEVWIQWKQKTSFLEAFYKPVLSSMPKGSLYFGGTDYGRLVITAANAVTKPPPVYCITQNALADNTYMAHLRATLGADLWMPQEKDSVSAFQQYVDDVWAGRRMPNDQIKIENGRVQISGAVGAMEINGILARMIFEHNRNTRDIFVEESYAIDWMYPYLEPHGLIMKLNKQPLKELAEATVRQDRDFWKDCVSNLRKERSFGSNREAQNAFSKLRCAIAGIYVYRKRYGDAEAAFLQAMELCPASPEVNVRLAMMYEEQGRISEALKVMTKYTDLDSQTIQLYSETYGPYSSDSARSYLSSLQTKQALKK